MGFLVKTSTKVLIYTAFVLFFATSLCKCLTIDLDDHWETYKTTFEKAYSTKEEHAIRRQYFEESVALITKHNLQENMQKHTYQLGINHLSDMSSEEFENQSCFQEEPVTDHTEYVNYTIAVGQPKRLDYRKKGMVGRVQNQGQCACCYAFSSMWGLEAQMKKKTGKLVELSPQNIVDCSGKQGNKGCGTGKMVAAFQYVIDNGGVNSDSSYPFEMKDGKCRFKKSDIAGTCKSFKRLKRNDEESLYAAVAENGPVSVAFYANRLFQRYKKGIFNDPKCNPKPLNHALLLVGYGQKGGTNYWIAKNSYGTKWGMKGYAKIVRGKNMCSVARQSSFPIV